jgi:hypothetical protein
MFDEYLDFFKNKSWINRNIKNKETKKMEREEKGSKNIKIL